MARHSISTGTEAKGVETYSNLPSPQRDDASQKPPLVNGALAIVVMGASGDLAKKKTFPALFALLKNNLLPAQTLIYGYARSKISAEDFAEHVVQNVKFASEAERGSAETQRLLADFKRRCSYVQGQYDRAEDFRALSRTVAEGAKAHKVHNRIFYLALPPSVYKPVTENLKRECYADTGGGFNKVVIEKPFGRDLASSNELSAHIGGLWAEEEVYRIDHYLGKEMVKNVMVLRFANTIFGAVWNRKYIDNVQITFKENFGTEGRGGYFDEFGIIRDVMQNHLLQILTVIAMETPVSLQAEDIRNEKVKVLRCIQPLTLADVCVGQYTASAAKGKPGYTDDEGVPKDSITPTFASVVYNIRNDRWDGVPFILKCGKALNEQKAEIRIQMRDVPGLLFSSISRNELVIRVQPNEAVYMKIMNKRPGLSSMPMISELDLSYRTRYGDVYIPDAYESLILDILNGDHSNFVRADELSAAWKILTPVLHQLESERVQPEKYEYGSRGPESADVLTRDKGRFKRHEGEYTWKGQTKL